MKVELSCARCGGKYLLDQQQLADATAGLPCPACGEPLRRPVQRSAVAPEPARRDDEVVCPRCDLHFVPSRRSRATAPERRSVLLVEDLEYFREIATDALSERFDVRAAEDLGTAQDAVRDGGIDLIVLDLTLGDGEDGKRLLQSLPSKPCPILIFTAKDESEMYGQQWEELQALGADDMVLKGMNVGETLLRKACDLLGMEAEPERPGA